MYPFDEIRSTRDGLVSKGETIAVAESVTSGHLQAALSLAEDARQFYQGGITAYNLGQKSRHLLIEPIHAIDCDCVSGKVAEQMALEVTRFFRSTFGLGITGYAAKVPEKGIEQPFAYFSIVRNNSVLVTCKAEVPVKDEIEEAAATLDALRVQLWYTRQVLEAMVKTLTVG